MPNIFGLRLRELYERAGLTQTTFADAMGLSKRAIIKWESGEREPSWTDIQRIADLLECTCTDLQAKPEKPPPPRKAGRPPKPKAEPSLPPPAPKPRRKRGS